MSNTSKLMTIFLLFLFSTSVAQPDMAASGESWVKPKQAVAASQAVRFYLAQHQQDGKVKIWVYFTDKEIFTARQMQAAQETATQKLSARARARRAKHGVTEIKFTDLPVSANYVAQVENTGANFRHVSKWLNAASFEVKIDQIDQIGVLPCVQKIEPVALYKKDYNPMSESKKRPIPENSLDAYSLSYGGSYAQLNQINVPICHDSRYTGQGVIISVFDTGFRKSHNAFAQAYAEGRVLAEWDFVFGDGDVANEAEDLSSAWNHGTSTWSICGGASAGVHYGPGFGASFILCKTEDVRGETPIEEDNWVAASEWVDSIGADIITSSLSYTDWYTASDYDGNTCVTTVAADIAAANGILVCNSAGNGGPGASTIGAPADADSILAVGAVDSYGTITYFSSRGPTYDGRIKPEVCARGYNVHRATSDNDGSFSPYGSGTSFSCPLVAGAAAIVMSAQPAWTNMQVREALMLTADNTLFPNSTYGWGIIDTWAAIQMQFEPSYVAGDADGNSLVNIADVVYLINYVFAGGPLPDPWQSGDADGDGSISIADVIYMIAYIFGGGPPPVEP